MKCLPDEILLHRAQLLTEEANALQSEIWRIRQELRRRQAEEPRLRAFLDEKQAREVARVDLGPIV